MGTSHRRIAQAAGVPLGSTTYHFSSLDEMLCEAFRRLATERFEEFRSSLEDARTPAEAKEVIVASLIEVSHKDASLTCELHVYAARNPSLAMFLTGITQRYCDTLQQQFDATSARALAVFIETVRWRHSIDDALTERERIHSNIDLLTQF